MYIYKYISSFHYTNSRFSVAGMIGTLKKAWGNNREKKRVNSNSTKKQISQTLLDKPV